MTGDVKFLILDPHYTGSEDIKTINNKVLFFFFCTNCKENLIFKQKRDGLDGKILSFGMKTLFIICAVLSDQKVFSLRYNASKFKQKKTFLYLFYSNFYSKKKLSTFLK